MTTAIATKIPQALVQSLPEDGLRLLETRFGIEIRDCPYRGRHIVAIEHPPLTDRECAALELTRDLLTQALGPGNRAVLVAQLVRLANHRPKERSAEEWKMLFEDFADDLSEFSDAHTVEAIREHRQRSNWFPTIAEIRTRCMELVARDKHRLERCQSLIRQFPSQ